MTNSVRLRSLIPEEAAYVSESGIRTAQDIQVLRENHVDAVLIGETLMRSPKKREARRNDSVEKGAVCFWQQGHRKLP